MKKIVLYVLLAGIIIFGLIQLLPIGKDHTNPPMVSEPNWDSPATRVAAKEHCFQCHSNETVWPWYSNIAPGSWLSYADVVNGRRHFNFSDAPVTMASKRSPMRGDYLILLIESYVHYYNQFLCLKKMSIPMKMMIMTPQTIKYPHGHCSSGMLVKFIP
jgi:hypothetical protein